MDIPMDKLAKEDLDMATKKKLYEKNWISSNSSTKQTYMETNYVKAKIDNTQQNITCRLCSDRRND